MSGATEADLAKARETAHHARVGCPKRAADNLGHTASCDELTKAIAAALAAERAKVLEECAELVDTFFNASHVAAAIRALQTKDFSHA